MYHNDEEILRALKSNRNEALREVYKNVYPSIKSYILNNSGSEEESKDIFQEAMIVFYQKAVKDDFHLSAAIKTFVFAVAKNLWLKKLRDTKKTTALENYDNVIAEDPDGEGRSKAQEKVHLELVRHLNALGDPCKKLLVYYYYDKKSMDDISNLMGYSNSNSAKNQKYKCLQRLRKAVPENLLSSLML